MGWFEFGSISADNAREPPSVHVRATFFLFIVLCLCGIDAQAQTSARGSGAVRLNDQVRYYEVYGRSEQDLLQAMLRGGPVSDGGRFFGLTSTEIRYAYWKTPTRTGCELSNIEVNLSVVTTMPRWRPYSGTPYDLERRWRVFERNLEIHENGHKQLALEEANMIARALDAARASSCDAMDAEARRLATRVRETYLSRHHAYDARTDHGTTQGAVWPVRTSN